MRKHKSVVAILLAVMMIFTFMPTMAFAAPAAPEFSKDYKSISYDGKNYPTVFEFNQSSGLVEVTVDETGITGVPDVVKAMKFEYFDLANAEFAHANKKAVTAEYISGSSWSAVTGLLFSAPADTKDASKKTKVYIPFGDDYTNGLNDLGTWTGEVVGLPEGGVKTDSTEDQEFDLELKVTFKSISATYPDNSDHFWNSVAKKHVKVDGDNTGKLSNAKFYLDKVVDGKEMKDGKLAMDYDGAEHTVVMNDIKGYTPVYHTYNTSTGKWDEATTPVTVKEVGETEVKVTFKDAEGKEVKTPEGKVYGVIFKVVVDPSEAVVTFGFDKDGNAGEYAYKDAEGFDPYKYVTVSAGNHETREFNWRTYQWETIVTPATDAEKAAVKANEAELLACFADYCEIEQTSTKANPSVFTLKIVDKKDLDYAALAKKYKALAEKFDIDSNNDLVVNYSQTATVDTSVAPVVNDKDDDISFEGQTKYVYSGKKTTKKGVLKTKKTITVNATADSGNAITYVATKKVGGKIVVSADGKITVKKGLKKGTYSVTVKAKTAAGNGYKAAKEKQTYIIKIAK